MWPGALLLQHTHVHIQGDMKKRERETLHINNFVSFYICRQAEWIHFVRLSVSECFDTNGDRFWSLLSRAASCPVKKFQVRRELRTLSLSFTLSHTCTHKRSLWWQQGSMACGGFESRDHESVARWEISQQCISQSDYRFSQFDNASSQRRRPKGIVFVRDALATCHLRLELENVCISDEWKQNILNLFIPMIRGLYQKGCVCQWHFKSDLLFATLGFLCS